MMDRLYSCARGYITGGLSIIPIDSSTKKPAISSWKQYQERIATDTELEVWFQQEIRAIAAIGGKVSGGLEILDFDVPEFYELWQQQILKKYPQLLLPTQRTGSGGYQVAYRAPNRKGNQKLAWKRDDEVRDGRRIAIETRGKGGYAILAPSLHPSGNYYKILQGSFDNIPELREEIAEDLLRISRQLCEMPYNRQDLAQLRQQQDRRTRPASSDDVIQKYNADHYIQTILEEYGYTEVSYNRMRRPDGTNGSVVLIPDSNVSFHWSSNDPLHRMGEGSQPLPVDPFDVFTWFEHTGDYRSAYVAIKRELGEWEENYNLTDLGNAHRLISLYGDTVRYDATRNRWLLWQDTYWAEDRNLQIENLAQRTVTTIYTEAGDWADAETRKAIAGHAKRSEDRGRLSAMVHLARSNRDIVVTSEILDQDPWLLTCRNGTLDLRSGRLRPHRKEDMITKLSPTTYDEAADCPLWEECLNTWMRGNQQDIRFLQKAVGYSLTGSIGEQCLFFLYGFGRNGKSTFIDIVMALLGDYAHKAPTSMIMAKDAGQSGIPNDIAQLKGVRFTVASELEKGKRLAEALVKDLTGNDPITARFLHQEYFTFWPTHKLWMYGNHKPVVRGTDDGIWRRIRLIPFVAQIPTEEMDTHLESKLMRELSGILRWAVEGCMLWQNEGLRPSESVENATNEYRSSMDVFSSFLTECCTVGIGYTCKFGVIYERYKAWCSENGERLDSAKMINLRLTELGFTAFSGSGNVSMRKGLTCESLRRITVED